MTKPPRGGRRASNIKAPIKRGEEACKDLMQEIKDRFEKEMEPLFKEYCSEYGALSVNRGLLNKAVDHPQVLHPSTLEEWVLKQALDDMSVMQFSRVQPPAGSPSDNNSTIATKPDAKSETIEISMTTQETQQQQQQNHVGFGGIPATNQDINNSFVYSSLGTQGTYFGGILSIIAE